MKHELIHNHQKQPPPEVIYKKLFLKKFKVCTGKHLCWSLFLIMLQACNFTKKDSNAGVLSEYCEIFKNTYVEERLLLNYLLVW